MLTSSLVLFALASSVVGFRITGCDIKSAVPSLPSGQSQLAVPSGETPIAIGLGIGVQNYTCGSTGTYTNIGAVAELLDISCLYKNSIAFEAAEDIAFTVFNESESVTVQEVITTLGSCFDVLGQHYFVPNPFTGSGNSPVFDFRAASEKGNPNAYVLANKTGDVPAPTGKQDVDWLQLVQAQGQLAKHVFRLETKAGQPPSSCTPGSPLISVKYAAKYWFYN